MKYLVPVLAVALCACSNFEFKSNLAPSNFKEYFKPSYVTVVTDEELMNTPSRSVGFVEGLSCKVVERDPIPTEADARTDAKVKAVDMGANAIRFAKCVRLENTPACMVSVTCYAEALVIDEQKQ